MKTTRLLLVALFASLFFAGSVSAQAPAAKKAEKSPADLASDAFYKVYNDKEAKLTQEQFKKVIDAGFAYLSQYPTHGKAPGAVTDLGHWAKSITDKKLAAYRGAYVAQLKYEVVNQRYKEGLTDDAKAAFAAVEAAAVEFEAGDATSRDNVNALREKIDALAAMPGSARFLRAREENYAKLLLFTNSSAGEAHLKKLLTHADKGVQDMARTELNIIEVKKVPYDLKFTTWDGKPVDLATLRGKVVALVVWSGTSDNTVKMIDAMKQVHSFYKKNFEVIGVSFDKEADREKVAKFIKDNKISWPVHYDGKEAKNEWASKLNVTKAPAVVLLDKKGMFVRNNQATNNQEQLEKEIKRLVDAK
jgi:cytochrome oxidase Cu insertion factor (SCO1/SenC/PrrC family)